jgi:hypothetical protein
LGVLIVGTWLVMIGVLVRKTHFIPAPQAASAPDSPYAPREAQREWLEIYLKGRKIGYAVGQVKPLGDEGYLIQDEMFMRLSLMGVPSQVHSLTVSAVDRDFSLKNFRFTLTSGVVEFQALGTVEGEWLRIETGRAKDRRTTRLRLSKPPVLPSGLSRFFRGRTLREGETHRLALFDPSTLSETEAVLHVKGSRPLEIHRIVYPATEVSAELLGQRITLWLDEKGEVLKEEGLLGLTLVKSSAARAMDGVEAGEGSDLSELAAVPVEKRIRDPRRVAYLRVRIEGLEDFFRGDQDLGGRRQRFRDNTMEITRETVPREAGYTLPEPRHPPGMDPYLLPEHGIESDAQAVVNKAREVAGGVRDPVLAARRISSWVYQKVQKRPVLSVPSASEVLGTLVGDCNEHAVLLTALFRASGIPARICVGLVLVRDKFYYHAWTEAYLGDWVSVDATLDQMPADATHITFAQGGLERQIEVIRLMGKIRMEVLEFRHD